jgi:tellurite resistance protein TehA-like permease
MGQCSTALLALSSASLTHFPHYDKGIFLTASSAQALHAACMMFSLLMFGFGVFWTFYGVYALIDAVVKREAKWTPAWYSTIFPAGK